MPSIPFASTTTHTLSTTPTQEVLLNVSLQPTTCTLAASELQMTQKELVEARRQVEEAVAYKAEVFEELESVAQRYSILNMQAYVRV